MAPGAATDQDPGSSPRPGRRLWRWAPLLVLGALAVGLYASGAADQLSLANLARHRLAWTAAARAHPFAATAAAAGAYAVIVGAGVPIAMLVSLTCGLVLGPLLGGVAILFGSTAASLPAYLAVRTAVAPPAEGGRMAALVEQGRRNGFSFVLAARFAPLVPFSLVNAAAGLARVPFPTYAAATLVGAVPTSFIYAGLGAGLGDSLDSRSIAAAAEQPRVLIPLLALSVLALAPMVWRRLRR